MSKSRRRLFTECLEARDVPNATLTGSTFEDANLDGFYAQVVATYVGAPPSEAAVAGVTVELDLGGDGTYEQTTTSDAAGEYRFNDVPDGSHKIRVTKAGFVSTTFSPNYIGITNGVVVLPVYPNADFGPEDPGQLLQTPQTPRYPLNFGLVRAGGIASGTVFYDINGNGNPDDRDTGINRDIGNIYSTGAIVNIFDAASKLVVTARTNSFGNFAVASLPDGNYTAVATSFAERGFVVNGPTTFTIAGGKAVTGVNIQVKSFGEITGTTFEDANANGVYEAVVGAVIGAPPPEAPLAGATVTLDLDNNGTIDRTTTSDASGKYTFTDLPDGEHTITTSKAGFTSNRTALARLVGGYRQMNPIPLFAQPPEEYQPRVGVLPRPQFFFDDSLDLGLTKSAIVALGVYEDVNENAVQDFDERGIPNETIVIDLDSDGTDDLTKTTDANGNLVLTGIPNGRHTARNVDELKYGTQTRVFAVADGKTVTDVVFGTSVRNDVQNDSFVVSTIGIAGPVRIFDSNGNPKFDLNPFPNAVGGTRAATGDVNGDGVDDVIIGVGPGASGPVLVFDGATQKQLFSLEAFEASFMGGVNVALADVTGDGKADAIITPGDGGGARVRVYDGVTKALIADFFGIDDVNFRGGAVASGADVNGDGVGDLIVAAGMGGGPRVAGWNGKSLVAGATPTRAFDDFFAFESTLRNGVYLASGDVDGDGKADIIVGGGASGSPRVTVFGGNDLTATGKQTQIANFFAGDSNDRTGVRVSAKDIDGDGKADIITSSKSATSSTEVNAYLANGISMSGPGETRFHVPAFAEFQGGVFVG